MKPAANTRKPRTELSNRCHMCVLLVMGCYSALGVGPSLCLSQETNKVRTPERFSGEAIAWRLAEIEKSVAAKTLSVDEALGKLDALLPHSYYSDRVNCHLVAVKLAPTEYSKRFPLVYKIAATTRAGGSYLRPFAMANPEAAVPLLMEQLRAGSYVASAGLAAILEQALPALREHFETPQGVALPTARLQVLRTVNGLYGDEEVKKLVDRALEDEDVQVRCTAADQTIRSTRKLPDLAWKAIRESYDQADESTRLRLIDVTRFLEPPDAAKVLQLAIVDTSLGCRSKAALAAEAGGVIAYSKLDTIMVESLQRSINVDDVAFVMARHPEQKHLAILHATLAAMMGKAGAASADGVPAPNLVPQSVLEEVAALALAIAVTDPSQFQSMWPMMRPFVMDDDRYVRGRRSLVAELGRLGEVAAPAVGDLKQLLDFPKLYSKVTVALTVLAIAPPESNDPSHREAARAALSVLRTHLRGATKEATIIDKRVVVSPVVRALSADIRYALATSKNRRVVELATLLDKSLNAD